MCFVNDYEWYAEVVARGDFVSKGETFCQECGQRPESGSTMHNIYQREHEECSYCEDGKCECENPNFGETCDYDRCHECHLFIEAVEAAEVEAGCHRNEARPSLCGMIEEIGNGDMDEAKKYFKKAAKMYPELAKSGYLGSLWRKMF